MSSIELHADGDQVLFSVYSPDLVEVAGAPLVEQIHQVLTIADGLIVGMDQYRAREEAAEAMAQRRESIARASAPTSPSPPPVDGLIPFVHVGDVARSVAFYELLGFAVDDTHEVDGRLDWAALRHGDARIMLAHRKEQGHHLAPHVGSPRPITPQPHQPARERLDPRPPGERRDHRDPGIRDHPLVIDSTRSPSSPTDSSSCTIT